MTRWGIGACVLVLACACGGEADPPPAPVDPGVRGDDASPPGELAAKVPPEVARQRVFDLVDNRALAHWHRDDGLVILAGTGGAAKYLWPGNGGRSWSRPVVRDGEPAAVPGRTLRLQVPLSETEAAALRSVSMRVYARRRSAVTVGFNERDRSRRHRRVVTLQPGWQDVAVTLPKGAAAVGDNALRLRFRDHGAAVAWIQLGPRPGRGPAPAVYDADRNALVIHRGLTATFYAWIPHSAELSARVPRGCALEVRAVGRTATASGRLEGESRQLALSGVAGGVAAIHLRTDGCDIARLDELYLDVRGKAPAFERGKPPKNVILWVMDTLRADRVRAIDPDARAETPVMERLAKSSAVFRSFYVEGNESQTSHSSLFTSVYPAIHKVITAGPRENYRLSPRFAAIAPLLKDAGFQTVGVTANGNVHSWTGYRRGFEVFNNIMRDGTGRRRRGHIPGSIVYDRVLSKLATVDVNQPFFLFIGTVDTHKPWVAKEPWLSKYDPEPYRGWYKHAANGANLKVIPGTHVCTARLSKRDKARILALYDSNISFQDALVGKLLAQLDAWGIRDDTMLIITADHGEELWEYPRKCGHGSSLRESLVRVPLIVHYPPMFPGGVVEGGVDGVDVLPTILDVLGHAPIDQAQGESLVDVANGVGARYPRPAYATMNEMAHTMRLGPYKMWVGMAGVPALYDVTKDPDERRDLIGTRPAEARFMRDALGVFLAHRARWRKSTWGVASNMTADGARALEPAP